MTATVITSGNFAKGLFPGIKKWTGDYFYKEYSPLYSQFMNVVKSDKAYEEYVGTSGSGLPSVKTEAGSFAFTDMRQGFVTRLTNTVYGLGVIVTREAVDDDKYGLVGKKESKMLAKSIRAGQETVCANLLNNGFSSSLFTTADGVALFSTAHLNKAGGTYSNKISTDADLSETTLEQAVTDIRNFTNDAGLRIQVMPKKLLVSTSDEFNAQRILKSINTPDTANNAINAIRSLNSVPDGFLVNPYFTDNDAWFLTTDNDDGLTYQDRDSIEMSMDNEEDTENAKFRARIRFAVGCPDPRGVYGSAGA